jgi:hypothetical protein
VLLRAVEADAIILGDNLRIIIPPGLSVAELPIGCGVAAVVHRQSD